jgi:hypothetical protein
LAKDRKVHKQHHWTWGQDPNDPDTSDPRWEFTNYEKLQPPAEPTPSAPRLSGPDSEVECFDCHHNTYRIVMSQTVIFKSGWGSTYTEERDTKLMLVCPNCGSRTQVYQSYLDRRKHESQAD